MCGLMVQVTVLAQEPPAQAHFVSRWMSSPEKAG
jgi:hypothetical protein